VDQRVTAYVPPRLLAWTHEAERLDGKPAPRFAASTDFAVRLEPQGSGTNVTLQSRQEPVGRIKGLIMRAFGRRELHRKLDESLTRLDALVTGDSG
jgi:hypothetical protein